MSKEVMMQGVLRNEFDFGAAITETKEHGYYFADQALTELARTALAEEIASLPLAYADQVEQPINAGLRRQVRQRHERFYTAYSNPMTPMADTLVAVLTESAHISLHAHELTDWMPREIGYQRYYERSGFIGPHRDRSSDRRLSVTFTIGGCADVRVFETIDDPHDYTLDNLEQTDSFTTSPGSIMLLRAPGLGSGKQIIHQVLPPFRGERTIINLRDRLAVLPQPEND